MQFKVPLLYKDLTLGQLMILETETSMLKRVAACANISIEQLRKLSQQEVMHADIHLSKIKDMETGKHKPVIELGGKQYGFIPDWNAFTLGEWIDMESYCEDFWANAHKIAALLYRPIERKQGDVYTIAKYTAKEDAEAFKELPADLFAGCMLFFSTTRKELQATIRQSLIQVVEKQTSLESDGDGTVYSTPLLTRILQRWTKLVRLLQELFSRILPISKT